MSRPPAERAAIALMREALSLEASDAEVMRVAAEGLKWRNERLHQLDCEIARKDWQITLLRRRLRAKTKGPRTTRARKRVGA